MRTLYALWISALVAIAGDGGDEAAIRKVLSDAITGFNRHEARLVPEAYSNNVDIVSPTGGRVEGRPDLGEAFKTFLKTARKIESVQRIRFIRPDVALVDAEFELTGTDLKPYPKGLETIVLVKENGRWMITALRTMIPVATAPPK
jgi:uncharacterized protein (TIGR02246 family)